MKGLEPPSQNSGKKASKHATLILTFLGVILLMNTFSSEHYLAVQQTVLQTSLAWTWSSSQEGLVVDGINYVPPVEKLAKSYIQDGIECPYPLIPIYDKIVKHTNNNQNIPNSLHFAWIKGYLVPDGQSRCISPDFIDVILKWMEHFPSYSVHFHDDESVDALFAQQWPEFPALDKIMKSCVMYGNAMKIDIWRQLLMYRYGGIYVDLDMMPGHKFTEDSILSNDSAVFLSDSANRPSQWFMAMERKSPIAYFTLLEIINNLQKMDDVSDAKLVWTTGPAALLAGYEKVIGATEDKSTILWPGVHKSPLTTGPIRKYFWHQDYILRTFKEKVPYPRNFTTRKSWVSKKERAQAEMNGIHWQKLIQKTRHYKSHERCIDLMYKRDMNATQVTS